MARMLHEYDSTNVHLNAVRRHLRLCKQVKGAEKLMTAIRNQKMAEAEEAISQATLRRQYELNYLEARKEFGRTTAERLFPQIGSRAAKEEPSALADGDAEE